MDYKKEISNLSAKLTDIKTELNEIIEDIQCCEKCLQMLESTEFYISSAIELLDSLNE